MSLSSQPLTILLADDDPGHATLVLRSLARAGVVNELISVSDGQDALDYVYGTGKYAARVLTGPLLLVLDINMPNVDGVEVLRRLKADDETRKIPVIMLTCSADPREIDRCYGYGCSVYLTKPVQYADFIEAIQRLGLLLQIVRMPSQAVDI